MEVIGGILLLWFIWHFLVALLGSTGQKPLPLPDNATTVSTQRKAYTNTMVWPPEKPDAYTLDESVSHIAYTDYIANSAVWQSKRVQRLEIDNYTCQSCFSKENLHVHHITYKNLFNERVLKELVTVCKTCHDAIHTRCGLDAGYYPIK